MIKLNNKNITYVALADSNNSIKAPKEIWYADSNNSVKLVYRRKDALIEGEDYEKYHWLVSNSEDSQTPYIDTLIPPNLNQNIVSSFKVINSANNGGEPGIWGAILGTSWANCVIRCFKPKSYGYTILEYNNNNVDFPSKENMIIKTEFSEGKEYDCSLSINSSTTALGVINGESKELVANSNVNFVLNPQPTYKLFVEQNAPTWSFNSVGFKKFNITNLISLVPCKLLKPVPKWLDANGIRRNVGECGMIDLISGKFYGNVNSVGTFTVENYYERKEWLVGDGSAYIDTGIIYPAERFNIRTSLINNNDDYDTSVEGSYSQIAFTNRTGSASNSYIHINPRKDEKRYYCDFQMSREFIPWTEGIPNIIDVSMNNANTNASSLQLFYSDRIWTTTPWDGSIGELVIQSQSSSVGSHFIPCTLTMDLPASMDANNIARTKGTSGMWDLVSDRFYGNVASSGTFKAVNLAEGVDYERHKWLIVQYKEYEQATLPIQSNDFNYKYKFYSFGNIGGVLTTNNNYIYYSNVGSNGIWGKSERNNVYRGKFYELNTEISINCDANGITMDGELMPNYGSSPYFDNLKIYCYGSTTAKYALSSITVDGIERYIPVKLLKSIPSKYDANGIARQAGECGMYDTVNDVFYGNVASSGTFSVSDDS